MILFINIIANTRRKIDYLEEVNLILRTFPFSAVWNERNGSVWPEYRQTVIVAVGGGDQDGGSRTAFRVRQHSSRFRRDR